MTRFRDLSIRSKLLVLSTMSAGVALILAFVALLAVEIPAERRHFEGEREVLASVAADSVAAALFFEDSQAAVEALNVLHADEAVLSVTLVDAEGRFFAGSTDSWPRSRLAQDPLSAPRGHRSSGNQLSTRVPVRLDGELIGHVILVSTLDPVAAQTGLLARTLGIVMTLSVLLSILLSGRGRRAVAGPVQDLVAAARRVAATGDYDQRVERRGQDEIGDLVDSFNSMLEQIRLHNEERDKLSIQLAHAQKLESIGQLAAGIAHEINTPTQFVGDNTRFLAESFDALLPLLKLADELADTVREATPFPERADEWEAALEEADIEYLEEEIPRAIGQSLGGIDRVRKIVLSMKEFSHPGAGVMTNLDLNRAIESTITVTSNEWKYVAEMETDFSPDLPQVPCLPGEINQVVLNLIVNAAHAIGDLVGDGAQGQGTITIRTRLDGEFAEVRVSDTGTGIPEEVRNKIFDPFFTTKEVGKGTGQGLAMVHGVIVQKHGGTIGFETEIGKGTTFIVRLPLVQKGTSSEGVAA